MKQKLYFFLTAVLITTTAYAHDKQFAASFLENKGQVTDQYSHSRSDIDFVLHSAGLNLFIGNGALHYQFAKAATKARPDTDQVPDMTGSSVEMYRVDVELVGADKNVVGIPEDIQFYCERYYTANSGIDGWIARSCNRVVYPNIYPGIDWVIYTHEGGIKYDFVVKEGADPSVIKMKYKGATSLQTDSKGGFIATTNMGNITEAKPYSYTADGKPVNSSFVVNGNELTYHIGNYSGLLTIDPAIAWGTYYGDAAYDESRGVVNDAAGNAYMVGRTESANNIATTGSYQQNYTGTSDGFLVKINNVGNRVWGTYYGGAGSDLFSKITIDNNNKLYAAGITQSPAGVFTTGAHQVVLAGGNDGLLVKFDTTGARIWATYYGGTNGENINRVVCDNAGNVLIAGVTQSTTGIGTVGTHQPDLSQGFDAFVAKFNASGVRQWGTYYGGISTETCVGLCVDNSGNVYIAGGTNSDAGISTVGSHQPLRSIAEDLYLVKFDPSGVRQWATYYGGSHNIGEGGGYLAYDATGGIYMVGTTRSVDNIATIDVFQPTLSLIYETDGFIVKFSEAGVRLWGSYYGTLGTETMSAIATDNTGNVFVGGSGYSLYLATACSPQDANAGFTDCFIGKVKADGTELLWSTYLGGTDFETVQDCSYDGNGNIFATGFTQSVGGFGTANVHQPLYAGGIDGYLVKYIDCAVPGQSYGVVGNTPVCEGDTVLYTVGEICDATSYVWDVPGDWYGYSTADTFLAVVGSSGTINVYASSGCGASSPQSLAVSVYAAPVPVVSQGPNIVFTTTNFLSYQWSHDGLEIPGATFPFYDITQTQGGYFTVTVIDSNGCKGTSLPFTLAVNSMSVHRFSIYPNPAGDEIFVDGLKQNIPYEIRNLIGSKLKQGVLTTRNNSILLGDIPKGVYLLKIGGESLRLLKE